jgi:hypothetical protein
VRLKHKTFPEIFVIHFSYRRKRQRISGSPSIGMESLIVLRMFTHAPPHTKRQQKGMG